MSNRVTRRLAITALAVLSAAALGASTAQFALAAGSTSTPATSPVTPTALKQRCEKAISRRLSFLGNLQSRVSGATVLTAEHRSALLGIIAGDQSGLGALAATIQAEASLSQLRHDCREIVTGYRVYVLLGPQVHLTIAADRVDFVDEKVQGLYGRVNAALKRCSAGSAECQAAEQAFQDLQSKVRQSKQAVAGVAAEVLRLTPAGYPGNASVVDTARTSVEAAHSALEGAWHDIMIIRQALRPRAQGAPPSTTPTPTPLPSATAA